MGHPDSQLVNVHRRRSYQLPHSSNIAVVVVEIFFRNVVFRHLPRANLALIGIETRNPGTDGTFPSEFLTLFFLVKPPVVSKAVHVAPNSFFFWSFTPSLFSPEVCRSLPPFGAQ